MPSKPPTMDEINSVHLLIMRYTGKDRIYSKQIIKRCNLRSLFHLTNIIHYLRAIRLQPICSGNSGYWWGTPNECDGVAESLLERAAAMSIAAKGLRRAGACRLITPPNLTEPDIREMSKNARIDPQ
jgi:hypothetical protein